MATTIYQVVVTTKNPLSEKQRYETHVFITKRLISTQLEVPPFLLSSKMSLRLKRTMWQKIKSLFSKN